MNLFTLMADTCHDTRSANRFFKEHGFGQFRIQAIKRTPLENRRTYGLFIRMADYNYHQLYQSTEFRDIIQAFEFYHCGGKEDDTMMLRDLPLTVAFIAADKKDGEKNIVQVISTRHDIEHKTITLSVATCNYSRTNAKVPDTDENRKKLDVLQKKLATRDVTKVRLIHPVVRAYAMVSNNNLYSGVSIKADDFIIVDDSNDNLFDS